MLISLGAAWRGSGGVMCLGRGTSQPRLLVLRVLKGAHCSREQKTSDLGSRRTMTQARASPQPRDLLLNCGAIHRGTEPACPPGGTRSPCGTIWPGWPHRGMPQLWGDLGICRGGLCATRMGSRMLCPPRQPPGTASAHPPAPLEPQELGFPVPRGISGRRAGSRS